MQALVERWVIPEYHRLNGHSLQRQRFPSGECQSSSELGTHMMRPIRLEFFIQNGGLFSLRAGVDSTDACPAKCCSSGRLLNCADWRANSAIELDSQHEGVSCLRCFVCSYSGRLSVEASVDLAETHLVTATFRHRKHRAARRSPHIARTSSRVRSARHLGSRNRPLCARR